MFLRDTKKPEASNHERINSASAGLKCVEIVTHSMKQVWSRTRHWQRKTRQLLANPTFHRYPSSALS